MVERVDECSPSFCLNLTPDFVPTLPTEMGKRLDSLVPATRLMERDGLRSKPGEVDFGAPQWSAMG